MPKHKEYPLQKNKEEKEKYFYFGTIFQKKALSLQIRHPGLTWI